MTKKQKQALAAEEAALAEAKSKEARRLAGLEKYRKRNLQQKNYRKTISAKAEVQMKKQQNQIEEQDLPGKDDAAIQQLAAIRVQSAVRKRQSHIRVKNIRAERTRAAKGLQRIARGRRDRRRVSLLQDSREAERVQRVQMAKELQRVARGRASRNRVKQLRKLSAIEKEAAEEAVRREMVRQQREEKELQLKAEAPDVESKLNPEEGADTKAKEEAATKTKEDTTARVSEEPTTEAEGDITARVKKEYATEAEENSNAKAEEQAAINAKQDATVKAKEEDTVKSEADTNVRAKADEEAATAAEKDTNVIAKTDEEAATKAEKDTNAIAKTDDEAATAAEKDTNASGEEEIEGVDEDEDDYGNDFSFESASTPMKVTGKTKSSVTPSEAVGNASIDLPPNISSPSSASTGKTSPDSPPAFSIGDRIEAQLPGWTKFYAGKIIEEPLVRSDGSISYSIQFDDGELHPSVDATLIRPITVTEDATNSSSMPASRELSNSNNESGNDDNSSSSDAAVGYTKTQATVKFKIGDRVEAQCSGWSKAYAGEIFDEPMVRADGSVSYSIKFDDGEIRSSVEGALVYGLPSESEVTTPPITATDTENEGQGARERSKIASLANSNESHRFNRGDRVEAQCSGWAKAYAGEIMDAPLVRSDGSVSYSIRFDDGEERSNVDGSLVSSYWFTCLS